MTIREGEERGTTYGKGAITTVSSARRVVAH